MLAEFERLAKVRPSKTPQQKSADTRARNRRETERAMLAEFERLAKVRPSKTPQQKSADTRARNRRETERAMLAEFERLANMRPRKQVATLKKTKSEPIPKAPKKRKESQSQREQRERAQRSAATRKKGLRGVSSKAKRSGTRSLREKVIGFDLAAILNDSSIKNPAYREKVRELARPLLGKTVQVTFTISVEDGDGNVKKTRVRRVVRDFRGMLDIAQLASSAVRHGYDLGLDVDGDFLEAYVSSISLSEVAE
jgi:hypothetical protein